MPIMFDVRDIFGISRLKNREWIETCARSFWMNSNMCISRLKNREWIETNKAIPRDAARHRISRLKNREWIETADCDCRTMTSSRYLPA